VGEVNSGCTAVASCRRNMAGPWAQNRRMHVTWVADEAVDSVGTLPIEPSAQMLLWFVPQPAAGCAELCLKF
jgi:hypothetical protein